MFVSDTAREWGKNYDLMFLGVFMESVFIKDMVLPRQLELDLSLTSKTRRIAEAKMISARVKLT